MVKKAKTGKKAKRSPAKKKLRKRIIPKPKKRKISKKPKKQSAAPVSYGKLAGEVVHYFTKIRVGVMKLKNTLKINDKIWIKGATTDFKQAVKSMQIDKNPISEAKKSQEIGFLVKSRVRSGDKVYFV